MYELCSTYKLALPYICDMLELYVLYQALWTSGRGLLQALRVRTKHGETVFQFCGTRVWNSKKVSVVVMFKARLKTSLFGWAYGSWDFSFFFLKMSVYIFVAITVIFDWWLVILIFFGFIFLILYLCFCETHWVTVYELRPINKIDLPISPTMGKLYGIVPLGKTFHQPSKQLCHCDAC